MSGNRFNTSEPGNRNRAPAPLDIVQSFLNTVDLEDGGDTFDTIDGLAAWVSTHMTMSTEELTSNDLERARSTREALRDILMSHDGQQAPPAALDRINRLLADAPLTMRFLPTGLPDLVPPASGIDGVVATLAAAVLTGVREGTWERLKVCRSDSCRWAFYDRSKNRSSVWCNMATCGSKAKVRAYRQRARNASSRQDG